MIGPEQPQRGRMPRSVKQAMFALYGQALICAATLYGLLSNISERNEHNQEVLPAVHVLVFTNAVVGVAVLICAVAFGSRQRWGRPAAQAVESLVILNGVYSLFSSLELGLVSIAFAVLTLVRLGRPEVGAWSTGDQPPMDHATRE